MDKCASWRGHKFEPRYSTAPVSMSVLQMDQLWWMASADRARLTTPTKTYICDVCVRCGAVTACAEQPQKGAEG